MTEYASVASFHMRCNVRVHVNAVSTVAACRVVPFACLCVYILYLALRERPCNQPLCPQVTVSTLHVRPVMCAVATPNIGPLQTSEQDLRPQQITLPDPTNMFKRPNIWCCYGISVCRRISPYDGSNSSMSAPAVRYATLRCGAHACVFCSHVP